MGGFLAFMKLWRGERDGSGGDGRGGGREGRENNAGPIPPPFFCPSKTQISPLFLPNIHSTPLHSTYIPTCLYTYITPPPLFFLLSQQFKNIKRKSNTSIQEKGCFRVRGYGFFFVFVIGFGLGGRGGVVGGGGGGVGFLGSNGC